MSTNGLMHISGTRRRIVQVDGSYALLEWDRRDRYYEEDATGCYRVSAARVGCRWRFSAWRREGETWVLMAVRDSAAEARSVCEREAA